MNSNGFCDLVELYFISRSHYAYRAVIDNKNAAIMTRQNSLLDDYDSGKLLLIDEVVEIKFPEGNDRTILITDKVPIECSANRLRFAIGVLIERFYDNDLIVERKACEPSRNRLNLENLEKLRV